MDPFSAEGELVNIHSAFHQGQFQKVVDFDTSTFSSTNALPARILKLRARIALGEHAAVQSELSSAKDADLAAVHAFAVFSDPASNPSAILPTVDELATKHPENLTVQLLCGTVLARTPGREPDALTLLAKHTGALDAVALAAQTQLAFNRADLAASLVAAARAWAQDSLLVNMAEAWVGLRQGGREKYQAAFYVYEELATAAASASARMHVGQAVAELLLGRLPEAEAALGQAREMAPEDPDVLANEVVLGTVLGRDTTAMREKLKEVDPEHVLLVDLAKKEEAFDTAMAKYSPKFAVEA